MDTSCTVACSGNPTNFNQYCGGSNVVSVYATGKFDIIFKLINARPSGSGLFRSHFYGLKSILVITDSRKTFYKNKNKNRLKQKNTTILDHLLFKMKKVFTKFIYNK
jgi:hypothetical protein